jgi:hypothetical protein
VTHHARHRWLIRNMTTLAKLEQSSFRGLVVLARNQRVMKGATFVRSSAYSLWLRPELLCIFFRSTDYTPNYHASCRDRDFTFNRPCGDRTGLPGERPFSGLIRGLIPPFLSWKTRWPSLAVGSKSAHSFMLFGAVFTAP